MNIVELERKLVAAARAEKVNDAVPYAFAKRIMARLQSATKVDPWALWARGLWRAAAPCAVVAVVLAAWSLMAPAGNPPSTDLSQAFDQTVLAAAVQEPSDSAW